MSRTLRRFAVPFALALLFLLLPNPPALAAPGTGAFRITDWLEVLTRLWADSGCILDLHGGCRDSAVLPRDEGCGIDSGGKCSATPIWAPAGCILDPGGQCRDSALPSRDAGCGIDPGGNCKQ
ncbi:MAG TPA: hypothetical protein VGS22_04815 [Thermoanaerobaculia bacterium]|nr:hypothetical protein [Thermoanaerobaculia bacterium]